MARKNVSAQVVRSFLLSAEGQRLIAEAVVLDAEFPTVVGQRGRPNPAHVALFKRANRGKTYDVGVANEPTITVPVKTKDSAGRNRTKQVTLTTAEARTALGHPTSRKGRIPREALSEALSKAEAKRLAVAV